ncbi:TPA: cell wall-binding repeat-containing protein [Candidatus Saccharibacteria bacterium]|nr:cell wall-binding repeat-containing protein [Candidatus Saccharibacteria bacterium]HIO88047.1 cell wall-binding repeat-containing protein [Candidatus Saccharibacteria bacterium]
MDPNNQNVPTQNFGGVPSGPEPTNKKNNKFVVIGIAALVVVAGIVSIITLGGSDDSNANLSENLPASVDATIEEAVAPSELVTQASKYVEDADTVLTDERLEQIEIEVSQNIADEASVNDVESEQIAEFDSCVREGLCESDAYPPYRYSGSNRYATAADVSKKTFPNPGAIDRVVIVNGGSEIDMGLASSFANGSTTILLVEADTLPTETRTELQRIAGANTSPELITVGGSAAVSVTVQANAADALATSSSKQSRLGGANRYETATKITRKLFPSDGSQDVIYLASASSYADIMIANNGTNVPVLITDKDSAQDVVINEICRLGTNDTKVIVVGGPEAVDVPALEGIAAPVGRPGFSSTTQECEDMSSIEFFRYKDIAQLAGESRLETAVAVSRRNYLSHQGSAVIVNGYSAPDMLSASVLSQGSGGLPILLVNNSTYSDRTSKELKRLKAVQLFVVGGEAAVNESVIDGLRVEQFTVN